MAQGDGAEHAWHRIVEPDSQNKFSPAPCRQLYFSRVLRIFQARYCSLW